MFLRRGLSIIQSRIGYHEQQRTCGIEVGDEKGELV
jgi:hypothetical protein